MKNTRARTKLSVLPIVSRLYDELLITEEEKQKLTFLQPTEMKAAIFDLIASKDSIVAARIFLAIRSVKDEQIVEKKSTQNPFRNPLEVNTIVRNLFQFINTDDLKACRLVCKKWNFEAEPLLVKNGTVKFGYLRRPEDFEETFNYRLPSESGRNQTFTSFQFLEGVDWRDSELKNFINENKDNIQELELCGVNIIDKDGTRKEKCVITDWFADIGIPKLKISCIDSNSFDTTRLTFPLNIFSSTTHIKLNRCRIKMENEGPLLAPIVIELRDLKFRKGGYVLPEYCVNDSFDLTKAKDIKIASSYGRRRRYFTSLEFDWRKCVGLKANHVSLEDIKVVNWKDSKGKIKTLELIKIPFLEKTGIEMKELHFKSDLIDLFALPVSLEKIYLEGPPDGRSENAISCSRPITLPNLRFIKIRNSGQYKNFPAFFANCSKLQAIEIYSKSFWYEDTSLLNLDWLPKSVKRLKLEGIEEVRFSDYEKIILDKLVLDNYCLAKAANILEQIIPNVLILQWNNREFETSGSVLLFLQKTDVVLYIGPFAWDDTINVFELSPFMARVDKKAEYYVFENKQGRSISRKEFEDVKVIDNK